MSVQGSMEVGWISITGVTIVFQDSLTSFAVLDISKGTGIITLTGFAILVIGGRITDLITKYKRQNAGTDSGKLSLCIEQSILQKQHSEYLLSLKEDEISMIKAQNNQLQKLLREAVETVECFRESPPA